MNLAQVIHWKTDNAPGIRCFSERAYAVRRVQRDGGGLKDLHEVAPDCFVYWPPVRGAFPNADTLAQWEAEHAARPVEKSLAERVGELEARARS